MPENVEQHNAYPNTAAGIDRLFDFASDLSGDDKSMVLLDEEYRKTFSDEYIAKFILETEEQLFNLCRDLNITPQTWLSMPDSIPNSEIEKEPFLKRMMELFGEFGDEKSEFLEDLQTHSNNRYPEFQNWIKNRFQMLMYAKALIERHNYLRGEHNQRKAEGQRERGRIVTQEILNNEKIHNVEVEIRLKELEERLAKEN